MRRRKMKFRRDLRESSRILSRWQVELRQVSRLAQIDGTCRWYLWIFRRFSLIDFKMAAEDEVFFLSHQTK